MARLAKEYEVDKENLLGGHPRKLSPPDQHTILTMVRTGKASTAVQAAKHINTVIPSPVTVQTVRNVLKEDGYKSYAKKKRPDWLLLRNMNTGL